MAGEYQVWFELSATQNGAVDLAVLRTEAVGFSQTPKVEYNTDIYFQFDSPVSEEDRALAASIVASHAGGADPLKAKRIARMKDIDRRTSQLIGQGFSYSEKVFSLSAASQMNILGAYTSRADPSFTYPVEWLTSDNLDSVSLSDASDVATFYGSAMLTVKAHRESGAALKSQIKSAVTESDLNAIADNR